MRISNLGGVSGPDGYVDSAKLSAFEGVSRLIHETGDLPIEFVSFVLTGSTMSEDVHTTHSDASWTLRKADYDTMGTDEVRDIARSARQHEKHNGESATKCNALAIVAGDRPEV